MDIGEPEEIIEVVPKTVPESTPAPVEPSHTPEREPVGVPG